jgi:hypothetical protein
LAAFKRGKEQFKRKIIKCKKWILYVDAKESHLISSPMIECRVWKMSFYVGRYVCTYTPISG